MLEGDNMSVPEVELETLRSIYLDELDVQCDESGAISCVSIQLYPATADNLEEQYVTMCLSFKIPKEYPESIPEISIRNPRGLLDEQIDRITDNLLEIAENKKGSYMLFELIEAAKEQLTDENRPREDCAICLYGFFDEDVFMKTECYHYFHSHCLSRYVQCKLEELKKQEEENKSVEQDEKESSKSVLCPVCRVPLSIDIADKDFPEPVGVSGAVVDIDSPIIGQQHKMDKIYKKQLDQGGIIDIEAESRKYLLEISNVPDDPVEETGSAKVSASTSKESGSNTSNSAESGIRHKVSPRANSTRTAASDSQMKSNRNWKSKYPHKNKISDWTQYEEEYPKDENLTDEQHRQNFEPESPIPRGRRNPPNARQNSGRPQRGPRFGNGGNYRNDGRYQPRNSGYRQGNAYRNNSRPYNRRTRANDADSDRRGEPRYESSNASDYARKEEERQSLEHLSDDEFRNANKTSDRSSSYSKGSLRDHANSSSERVDSHSRSSEHQRPHSQSNRDWSSREVSEKPTFQRNQKPNHFKPKSQYLQDRGNGKQYQNYRDDSQESATVSPDAAGSYSRDEKPQRYFGNRGGYRNNGSYDNKQYGDRRRNPNWQPRHNNNGGPRYNNDYRNDVPPRRGSYKERNQQSYLTNSTLEEDQKCSISNGSYNAERKEDSPNEDPKPISLPSRTADFGMAESTVKVPQIQNGAQEIELKLSSCSLTAATLRSPPGFANPHKKVIYGLPSVNPPPGFQQS